MKRVYFQKVVRLLAKKLFWLYFKQQCSIFDDLIYKGYEVSEV
jgi:hypothetical protein